jgi:hypothetical protein
MKRIILLAALLLAASACTTTTQAPGNTNTAPTTTPANANASATPRADANATDNPVIVKEKEIWETIKRKDSNGFAAMLADDFVYVSSDGIYDKAGTVEGVKELDITDLSLSDWKVVMMDKDAALVTYTVNMKGSSGGEPIPATLVRASSAWVNRNGQWVGVYHQDTEAKEPPPDTDEAKPAASTEAKPASAAVTPAADHIAREKQIWDTIKKKDYDGFASFLADDQIEVFEWGVNDKAGSVKGIQQVDLSKAVLSGFRTMKLNDNAALVIYMVKGPTPPFPKDGERASSIWAMRGGKWLAVFHQSTPVQPAPAKATSKK